MQIEKETMQVLRKTRLFTDFTEDEISTLLDHLRAKLVSYKKGEYILREGQRHVPAAILISGRVHIIKEDFWGNRAILSEISRGEMFAETYACMPEEVLAVSAAAAETCRCLFLDFSSVMMMQEGRCIETADQMPGRAGSDLSGLANKLMNKQESAESRPQRRLLINLMRILAGKNLFLTKKMEHITQRTTRQKLLSYLSDAQRRAGKTAFDIPFDRQELADFLAVDRSAMSAELSKLQREGILEYRKNHFILKIAQM